MPGGALSMSHRWNSVAAVFLLFGTFATLATMAQEKEKEKEGAWAKKKPAWVLLSPEERTLAQNFAEEYKSYLNVARSALTSTREVTRLAKASGFTEFTKPEQVKPGARLII